MKRSDALVIVPAYNESESIESVVGTLEALPYDYIVINDGSTDSTAQKLDAMGAAHIGLCRNLGIGGAVQTGYKYALAGGWSVAVQFDGDGQVHRSPDRARPCRGSGSDRGLSVRGIRERISEQPFTSRRHPHTLKPDQADDRHPHP